MISFDEDILPPGVYTGFFKGGWTKLKKNFAPSTPTPLMNQGPNKKI